MSSDICNCELCLGFWVWIPTVLDTKRCIGIRVSPKEEMLGLDIAEHVSVAYSNFVCKESGLSVTMKR